MTREEVITVFQEKESALHKKNNEQIWEQVLKYESEIKELLIVGIRKLREEAERKGKENIAYIQFSLLRSELMQKKCIIILHGYDIRWYLDDEPIYVKLQFQEWIQDRIEQWETLHIKAKKYIGKINSYDINHQMITNIMEEIPLLAHALRVMCKDIEKNEDYKALSKEQILQIRIGEYRDHSEILHKIDKTQKTAKEFKNLKILLSSNEESLVYSRWYGLKLKREQVTDVKCFYIGFEDAILQDVSFEKSSMTGAMFINSELINCNFNSCILENTDFSGTRFRNCSFLEADLEGALFDEGELPFLNITAQQLQKIRINEGSRRNEVF